MKSKFMAFTVAVLLTVLFANSVKAQKGAVVSFNGIEISAGHQESGEAYGWMCYARTTGTFPGNLTLSMDYYGARAPGTVSDVTGGAWTLPVYATSNLSTLRPIAIDPYQGVLFGVIEAGAITWDKTGTGTIELKLLINGGTQGMADLKGSAVLYGTVSYSNQGPGSFSGSIYFEFQ
ncbi:MAG TPA: hypothetical protein VFH01_05850 [Pyrinomonadaceae bacterium]|nr:hypothetical protein [Pyrinomonadaceae bacterium]